LYHAVLADSTVCDEDFVSISALLTCYSKTENLSAYETFINTQLSGLLSDPIRKKYEETLALIKRLLGQYSLALSSSEGILDNPICIGNTHLESEAKLSGKYAEMIPKSISEHARKTMDLLTMLYSYGETGQDQNVIPIIQLNQNYPNPFNPSTTFSFGLPTKTKVDLTIYNIKGQRVTTLVSSSLDKGMHRVVWEGTDSNGKSVSSGVYFYKLKTSDKCVIKKCLLLK
jgi:hypothetical protein